MLLLKFEVCPRLLDLAERSRAPALQLLCLTAPHCEEYYSIPQNAKAFFSRLANLMDGQGTATGHGAAVATLAKRLFDLIVRVNPQASHGIDNRIVRKRIHSSYGVLYITFVS